MQTLKNILLFLFLQVCFSAIAQNHLLPYVVFNASEGVILKSSVYHEEFYPKRGTQLYEKDIFLLKDVHYFVKIKDVESGGIYTFKGKGKRTPRQIANDDRGNLYGKFCSILKNIGMEIGIYYSPVRTLQCDIYKGGTSNIKDSLSDFVATQIRKAISDSIYELEVDVRKVYSSDNESFFYSVKDKVKRDSMDYAIAIFTVGKDGIANKHRILVNTMGRPRLDEIEYIPLIPNYTLDLSFFSLAKDDNITCYVLIFNPKDFYIRKEKKNGEDEDRYNCLLNWTLITKELTYQGDKSRVIYLKR